MKSDQSLPERREASSERFLELHRNDISQSEPFVRNRSESALNRPEKVSLPRRTLHGSVRTKKTENVDEEQGQTSMLSSGCSYI